MGIPFRCRAPLVDEAAIAVNEPGLEPRPLAEALALAKASSAAVVERGAVIIGCDQLVSFDGRVLGKPITLEKAMDQLAALSGHMHELITALVVISGGRIVRHTDVTRLWMRPLAHSAIERYVQVDRPLDCAGSYKLESRGIILFERIESADHTAITGLPLMALVTTLRELGYEIP
jgi:septum formation protein